MFEDNPRILTQNKTLECETDKTEPKVVLLPQKNKGLS